jgi:hypothetical protein
MITDDELIDYKKTGFSFFTSFILIPAITINFNVFGYVNSGAILINAAMMLLTVISFVRRYLFLSKHRRFISNKQYYFQNISFILLMVLNIFSGFLPHFVSVEDGKEAIKYYLINDFNLLIWIPLIIFSFVLFIFMVITAKNIGKQISNKMKEINEECIKELEEMDNNDIDND